MKASHCQPKQAKLSDVLIRYVVSLGLVLASAGLGIIVAFSLLHPPASGTLLHLPAPRKAAAAPRSNASPKKQGTAKPLSLKRTQRLEAQQRSKRLGLGSYYAAGKLLAGDVHPEWLKEAKAHAGIPSDLNWPVPKGWFGRGYASGKGHYHLAIDIGAPWGTGVVASADGLVAYAGHEIRGFGHMVILVHANGWVTMYAHNAKLRVQAGELVRRGDLIAYVGSTGISRGPHVHYEFIHKGRNCDPTPWFRDAPPHPKLVKSKLHRQMHCRPRRKYPRR